MAEKQFYVLVVPPLPKGDKDAFVPEQRFDSVGKAQKAIMDQLVWQGDGLEGEKMFEFELEVGMEIFILDESTLPSEQATKALQNGEIKLDVFEEHLVIEMVAKKKQAE